MKVKGLSESIQNILDLPGEQGNWIGEYERLE